MAIQHPRAEFTIEPYVRGAAEATKRTRWTFLVVVTASVLVFAASFNARENSWIDARIEVAQLAFERWGALPSVGDCDEAASDSLDNDRRAAYFVRCYGIRSDDEVRRWLHGYIDSMQREVQLVRVPFFGFSFDVNDLGVMSGLTFCILLLLLRFWLRREHANVDILFEESRERGCLAEVYRLLSMGQVLTTPPVVDTIKERLWRLTIRALFALPLVVQLFVLVGDFNTRQIGSIFSTGNTQVSLFLNVGFVTFLVILTVSCVTKSLELDNVWKQAAVNGRVPD